MLPELTRLRVIPSPSPISVQEIEENYDDQLGKSQVELRRQDLERQSSGRVELERARRTAVLAETRVDCCPGQRC